MIGLKNNLIYKCNNSEDLKDFKSYLESSELKWINIVHLWYELDDSTIIFLTVLPAEKGKIWKIDDRKLLSFSFTHVNDNNLEDEIEEELKIRGIS